MSALERPADLEFGSVPLRPVLRHSPRGADRMRGRTRAMMFAFVCLFAAIGGRLVFLGSRGVDGADAGWTSPSVARPDIVDRNGVLLATDLKTYSLYADPRRILDLDEVVEGLARVFPDLDRSETFRKLRVDRGFVWLRRQLAPYQKDAIMDLGLPGLGFRTETRRYYPAGSTTSYILGLTNLDNKGISGLEKYIDDQGLADLQKLGLATSDDLSPVRLSIDLRVQHIVRDEAMKAMTRFRAKSAGAVVLNAKTGEVIAMTSVPDFDPENPADALSANKLNRMSAGLYEMGSTIKSFTTAMALDSGKVTLESTFDASHPIRLGRQTVHDFHGKHRVLTVPEVFIYSSNIGSALEAEVVGVEGHRAFLKRMGLLDRTPTELPEIATPQEPKVWKQVHSVTAAFGHGFSTTPLQTAAGVVALMNGGHLMPPTFFPRNAHQAMAASKQVVSEATSRDMRYLYRLNATAPGGSGKRGTVPGFRVGGKTGTAEKVVNGRYSKDKNFNAFVAAFPIEDPQYVVLTIIDEPKMENSERSATAGFSAAPIASNIIRRSAVLLGVTPSFAEETAGEAHLPM